MAVDPVSSDPDMAEIEALATMGVMVPLSWSAALRFWSADFLDFDAPSNDMNELSADIPAVQQEALLRGCSV